MRIDKAKFYRYSLPLKRPLILRGTSYQIREGLLVRLSEAGGKSGWGEIAPLPGFSRETLPEVLEEIPRVVRSVRGSSGPEESADLITYLQGWLAGITKTPSIRFGLESAVLCLIATCRGISVGSLLSGNPVDLIDVNALLAGSKAEILEKLDGLLGDGFKSFKLKIGTRPLDDEVDLMASVRERIGSSCRLRLDANRAFNITVALDLFKKIEPFDIEYIEEPVENLNQLRVILKDRRRKVPIALDESLLELNPQDLALPFGLKAIIIKPSLLGLSRGMAFARAAREHGILPVISSSFESSVGISMLVELAGAINGPGGPAAGLGTLDWFETDTVADPIRIDGGRIKLGQAGEIHGKIDVGSLEEVILDAD